SSADGRLEASPEAAMHTQLWVDPGEHFEAYCHRGDAVDVTFSVKEVKAFVQFCESAAADVVMLFHRAGAPLMLMPRFPNPHTTPTRNPRHAHANAALASDFDSRLVIATMLESQLPTPPPSDPSVHRASAQPGTPATPAHQAAATPQASAEAGAPVHKGSASRVSAEAGTPTVAVSGSQRSCHAGSGAVPHQAYPVGSGCREDPGGGGLGEGEEEGGDEMRVEEGAEKVLLKDPGAGARLEAGWTHGKRWSDLSGVKGTAHRAGVDSAGPGGGEGSGSGRRGSSTWPREQQQPSPGHEQQDQRQQQHDQYQQQQAANQVPDSEDATEELPIGRLAAASRGGSGGGGGGAAAAAARGSNIGGSVDGNGMVTGGAADVSARRFMPTEASTPGRQAAPHQRQGAEPPLLQRDPDRWIENTEDDEMEDRAGGLEASFEALRLDKSMEGSGLAHSRESNGMSIADPGARAESLRMGHNGLSQMHPLSAGLSDVMTGMPLSMDFSMLESISSLNRTTGGHKHMTPGKAHPMAMSSQRPSIRVSHLDVS
ncbi:unnamed protein product, partial [Closterium sp. NIES-54]